MAYHIRIDSLKTAAEAAGVAMAPSSDQFDGEPVTTAEGALVVTAQADAGNFSRSWASPLYRQDFEPALRKPAKLKTWFSIRWPRPVSF